MQHAYLRKTGASKSKGSGWETKSPAGSGAGEQQTALIDSPFHVPPKTPLPGGSSST